jgi:hypothetical protein
MDLGDDQEDATEFHRDDTPMPNIWSIDIDDDKKEDDDADKNTDDDTASEKDGKTMLDDDLDKPSFLRRLGRRHKDDEDNDEPTGE